MLDTTASPTSWAALCAAPWAFMPEHVANMQAIYAAHVAGPKTNIPVATRADYTLQGSVAIIGVDGMLFAKDGFFTRLFNGISVEWIGSQLKAGSHAAPALELMRPGSNCAASVDADYPMGMIGQLMTGSRS